MNAYYYYERDSQNRPITTRCFLTDGMTWARGTAVCSDADNPCKATGRRKAFGRAMEAFYRQRDERSRGEAPFMKLEFMPEPAELERKFMRDAVARSVR